MPKHWFGGSQRALQVMGITVQARGIGLGDLPKCSYSWDGCTAFPSGCRKCKDSHYFIPWAAGTWQAGVPIKAGTRGWDRDIPGLSSHPARRLVKLGCCLSSAPAATSSRGKPQLLSSRVWCNPVPAAPPGQPRGMPRWHPCWRRWTRHRWRAPCPAAPRHRAAPCPPPPAPAAPRAAPRPGESTPDRLGKALGSRMTSTTGSRRSRMLRSRTATAFLSLKTDFLERMAT